MQTSAMMKEAAGECGVDQLTAILFKEKHFQNCLGSELRKRPTKAKLEKFLTKQVERAANEATIEFQAEHAFAEFQTACAMRMQALQQQREHYLASL